MTTLPQEPKYVIYVAWCVCHPDGIRYVGQTSRGLNSRRYHHLWSARVEGSKSYGSHLSSWIRQHGEENIAFTVLEVCTQDELDSREMAWIALFRAERYRLVNVLEGGAQPRGHKNPTASRKLSGAGNPMYGKDRREVMAHARSFQGPVSEETRRKMSEKRKGELNGRAKLTEDQVRDIRSRHSGKWPYGEKKRVAEEFGVSVELIYAIVRGDYWKHVR